MKINQFIKTAFRHVIMRSKSNVHSKYLTMTLFASALILIGAAMTQAATFTVTNTGDGGAGSLRDAITQANATTADDTINFSIAGCPNGVCTITLTSGEFLINAATSAGKLTITNASGAANLRLDGNAASRIFDIQSGANFTLNGVTVQNGNSTSSTTTDCQYDGGGICNDRGTVTISNSIIIGNITRFGIGGGINSRGVASLTLTNSTVSNNTSQGLLNNPSRGGGIANSGTLTITNSTVGGNTAQDTGAGIYNTVTLSITNSTVSNNNAPIGAGGGIYSRGFNGGSTVITNVTISGNTAWNQGGGIYGGGNDSFSILNSTISGNQVTLAGSSTTGGGGIYAVNGNMLVTNSTISGNNSAERGGGIRNDTAITLTNSTVSNNTANTVGGGIATYNTLSGANTYLRNTIIAANTATNGQPDVYRYGTSENFTSQGNNLIGNANDTNTTVTWQASDILNQSAQLGALADNGGTTKTQALQTGSPAINAGNNCVVTSGCIFPVLTTDQRGFRRQVGASVDIGAYEFGANAASARAQFDYDGDGKADISVFRPSSGAWYLQQSSAGFTGVTFGFGTDKLVPADYDGDGKTDVAVYRNGTWYLMRSQLGFTGVTFGDANDIPVPADYDGDGKADIAVFRPSNGTWYLQQSTNGFTGTAFGISTDKPVPADYDGDGKADIAVNRSGTWYIQRSQLGFTGVQFGDSNDKLVPADYDGDGKADIAVFRPSNGVWYLQQSTAGFTGIAFGLGTDIPTAADYDGDGKADVAVFRNGTWYLQRSTQGFTGVAFGANTDMPTESAFVR